MSRQELQAGTETMEIHCFLARSSWLVLPASFYTLGTPARGWHNPSVTGLYQVNH